MNKFWLGFGLMVCWQNAVQQFIGKDRYLEVTALLWTNEPWWLWPLLYAVFVGLHFADQHLRSSYRPNNS